MGRMITFTMTIMVFILSNGCIRYTNINNYDNNYFEYSDNHQEKLNKTIKKWYDRLEISERLKYNNVSILDKKFVVLNNGAYTVFIVRLNKKVEHYNDTIESYIGIICLIPEPNGGSGGVTELFPIYKYTETAFFSEDWKILKDKGENMIIKGTTNKYEEGIKTIYDVYISNDFYKIIDTNLINVQRVNYNRNSENTIRDFYSEIVNVNTEKDLHVIYKTTYRNRSDINGKKIKADTIYRGYSITKDTIIDTKTFTPEEYKAATQGLR